MLILGMLIYDILFSFLGAKIWHAIMHAVQTKKLCLLCFMICDFMSLKC